jgi:tetratricopeptide (TPR) repeat protein
MIPLLFLALPVLTSPAPRMGTPTPAQRSIELALLALSAQPERVAQRTSLARALVQRSCESGDLAPCAVAHSLLDEVLALSPNDLGALRARVGALLAEQRFGEALELARELNRRFPDDLETYAALVEASLALDRAAEAEAAAQWMLDLRPGERISLESAAWVRFAAGDPEGALELLAQSAAMVSPAEGCALARISTEAARCERALGRLGRARALLAQAFAALPEFPPAHELAAVIERSGNCEE